MVRRTSFQAVSERREHDEDRESRRYLSSCRFFQASSSRLRWNLGKTHRNMLNAGLLHQQSGWQPQVYVPVASRVRVFSARRTKPRINDQTTLLITLKT
jgi:hypothetical protein